MGISGTKQNRLAFYLAFILSSLFHQGGLCAKRRDPAAIPEIDFTEQTFVDVVRVVDGDTVIVVKGKDEREADWCGYS